MNEVPLERITAPPLSRLLESLHENTAQYENVLSLLALLCLLPITQRLQPGMTFSGLERHQEAPAPKPASPTTPPAIPDSLAALLPLLQQQNLKKKINPQQLLTLFQLLHQLPLSNEKSEPLADEIDTESSPSTETPADAASSERALNWKSNF